MNRDINIIEKIIRYCDEICEAHETFGHSYEVFKSNSVYKNAVCLCLLQIGELTISLSDDFKEEHKNIPWRQIRGMRNVVAHQYGHIDEETVWETVGDDLSFLKDFCEGILKDQ